MLTGWDLPTTDLMQELVRDPALAPATLEMVLAGELEVACNSATLVAYVAHPTTKSVILFHVMPLTKQPVSGKDVYEFLSYESAAWDCPSIFYVHDDELQVYGPDSPLAEGASTPRGQPELG